MQNEYKVGEKVALVDYEKFFQTIKDARYAIATVRDVRKEKSPFKKDEDIYLTVAIDSAFFNSKISDYVKYSADNNEIILSFYIGAGPMNIGYEVVSLIDLYGYMERFGHELIDEGNFLLSHKEVFKEKYLLSK